MLNNKQLNSVVIKLFIRGRKLNIYPIFIIQCYFAVSKYFRLNLIHYVVMKIPNKRELQQIAFKHSSDINFQDFMSLYKKYCKTIFFFGYWYYSCFRYIFTFQKESFRKNVKLITTVDDKVKDENYNMILTEKQQKYQHYQQLKLINMNILQARKYCHLIKLE